MLPVMRYRSTGAYATATGTGARAATFPCSLMSSKSEIGTTLRIARDTGPRAGYHLSMALARINFLARFATLLWQSNWPRAAKRNALPRAARRLRKQGEAVRRRAALGLCCGRSLALIDDHLLTSTQQHHL